MILKQSQDGTGATLCRDFPVRTSILILDRDLGFLWAISQELRKHGISAIPSHSVPEAEDLLDELRPPLSLLLIDCRCPGACTFVQKLRRQYSKLRAIGITSARRRCAQCASELSATITHPHRGARDRIERYAEMIRAVVDSARADA